MEQEKKFEAKKNPKPGNTDDDKCRICERFWSDSRKVRQNHLDVAHKKEKAVQEELKAIWLGLNRLDMVAVNDKYLLWPERASLP
jgi:hypothetical protein